MNILRNGRTVSLLTVGLGLLLLAGCRQYKAEVFVDQEGGGRRTVELEVDFKLNEQSEPTLVEFQELFGLDPARGWRAATSSSGARCGRTAQVR